MQGYLAIHRLLRYILTRVILAIPPRGQVMRVQGIGEPAPALAIIALHPEADTSTLLQPQQLLAVAHRGGRLA